MTKTSFFSWTFYALLLITLVVCLMPTASHSGIPHLDKLIHFLNYLVLGLLAATAYPQTNYVKNILLPLVAFGLLIEVLQGFTGYRTFSLLDLLANASGLIMSGLITRRLI